MYIPARVNDGSDKPIHEGREITPELQGCLCSALGTTWFDNYQWGKSHGPFEGHLTDCAQ
jgi:hypothetical protein